MGSANERRPYYVTRSLIGRAHAQNDPCIDNYYIPYRVWLSLKYPTTHPSG